MPKRIALVLTCAAACLACDGGNSSPSGRIGSIPPEQEEAILGFVEEVEPIVEAVDWASQEPEAFLASPTFDRIERIAVRWEGQLDPGSGTIDLELGDYSSILGDRYPSVLEYATFAEESISSQPELAVSLCPGFPFWGRS